MSNSTGSNKTYRLTDPKNPNTEKAFKKGAASYDSSMKKIKRAKTKREAGSSSKTSQFYKKK